MTISALLFMKEADWTPVSEQSKPVHEQMAQFRTTMRRKVPFGKRKTTPIRSAPGKVLYPSIPSQKEEHGERTGPTYTPGSLHAPDNVRPESLVGGAGEYRQHRRDAAAKKRAVQRGYRNPGDPEFSTGERFRLRLSGKKVPEKKNTERDKSKKMLRLGSGVGKLRKELSPADRRRALRQSLTRKA